MRFIVLFLFLISCGKIPDSYPTSLPNYKTKYPIVLLGGAVSTNADSMKEIKEHLESLGCEAYLTRVDSATPVAHRAEQLKNELEALREKTHFEKVNLIAYSMGGVDARYLISALNYGSYVASLTTLGTPHRGSLIADLLLGRPFGVTEEMEDDNYFTHEQKENLKTILKNFFGALYNLSVRYMETEFNKTVLDDPNVFYQSWTGETQVSGEFGDDTVNRMLLLPYGYLRLRAGLNDGLVPTSSSTWGIPHLVKADHFDLVGVDIPNKTKYKYVNLFLTITSDLTKRGF